MAIAKPGLIDPEKRGSLKGFFHRYCNPKGDAATPSLSQSSPNPSSCPPTKSAVSQRASQHAYISSNDKESRRCQSVSREPSCTPKASSRIRLNTSEHTPRQGGVMGNAVSSRLSSQKRLHPREDADSVDAPPSKSPKALEASTPHSSRAAAEPSVPREIQPSSSLSSIPPSPDSALKPSPLPIAPPENLPQTTHSTIPLSSQGGANPPTSSFHSIASQRPTIRSSQSDDEEEILAGRDDARNDDLYASDDSLDQMDTFGVEARRKRTLEAFRAPQVTTAASRAPRNTWTRANKKHMHSLDKLIKENKAEEEKSVRIQQHQQAIDAADSADVDDSMVFTATDNCSNVNDVVLKHIVDAEDGEDDAERVARAIARTQTGSSSTNWRFFSKANAPDTRQIPAKEFAERVVYVEDGPSMFDYEYLQHLCIEDSREYSFMTGFAAEALDVSPKLENWVAWLCDSALRESREELRQAQIETLPACGSELTKLFTVEYLRKVFLDLGARDKAVEYGGEVKLLADRKADAGTVDEERSRLTKYFTLLEAVVPFLEEDAQKFLLHVLLKMGIDHDLMRHGLQRMRQKLIKGIAARVGSERLFKETGSSLFQAVSNVVLRRRLIESMPDLTTDLHELKRRLALAFVFEDESALAIDLKEPSDMASRTNAWLSDQTQQSREGALNMTRLACLALMLDVGVGEGFPVKGAESEGGSGAELSAAQNRTDKGDGVRRVQDAAVDAMAEAIHGLYVTILDKGVTDMQRTEVKNTLERTKWRLEHAMRSRAKKKENALLKQGRFGRQQWGPPAAASVALMQRFMKKGAPNERQQQAPQADEDSDR